MTAQKSTATELGFAGATNYFVLKILHVTRFDSIFCKGEIGSIEANTFVSKILQKGHIKNIFDHCATLPAEPLRLPQCVE